MRAPSLGRGCRAQRGGIGFLLGRRSGALVNDALETIPLCLPHWGRGTASAVDRVLSYIVDLRRISPLSFIPLVPYPPLRGTFPSRGRLCVEDGVVLVSLLFPHGEGLKRKGASRTYIFVAKPPLKV